MMPRSQGGGGGGQGFCYYSTKAFEIKSITMRGPGGGAKIVQNCVTPFMDDP